MQMYQGLWQVLPTRKIRQQTQKIPAGMKISIKSYETKENRYYTHSIVLNSTCIINEHMGADINRLLR